MVRFSLSYVSPQHCKVFKCSSPAVLHIRDERLCCPLNLERIRQQPKLVNFSSLGDDQAWTDKIFGSSIPSIHHGEILPKGCYKK